jgi:hypothetical protein
MALTVTQPTTPDTQEELSTGRSRERDETQVMIDGIYGELVAEWDKAGKPEPGKGNPFRRLAVAKADVSELKSMIRRAATLHKVAPVYWKDAKNDDGTVTVKFGAQAIPPKASPNGTTAETPATPAQPETPATAEPQTPAEAPSPAESESGRRGRFGSNR